MPFQKTGAAFLASQPRGLLFDAMRVGKTPQVIRACDYVMARSVLILCPAIARLNWLREFRRFGGREGAAIITRTDKPDMRLTVCSYDQLIEGAPDPFALGPAKIKHNVYEQLAHPWDVVVLDEAHMLKNPTTKRTVAAFNIAAAAAHSWPLTGTPTPNDYSELWTMLFNQGHTQLQYNEFIERFCEYRDTEFGRKITGNKNTEELRALLAPIMLRRTLAEVAPDMPPARVSHSVLEPGPVDIESIFGHGKREVLATASAQEAQLMQALDEAQDQIEKLDPDMVATYRRLVGLQKVKPTVELLSDELDNGMPCVVVFAWHTDVIRAIATAMRGYGARIIDGKTPHHHRESAQQALRDGSCRVLVCQILAAGTAIDLSTADDYVFVEQDWTPANNNQAAHRVINQFKRRPVRGRYLSLADTADERVTEALALKNRMIEKLFS